MYCCPGLVPGKQIVQIERDTRRLENQRASPCKDDKSLKVYLACRGVGRMQKYWMRHLRALFPSIKALSKDTTLSKGQKKHTYDYEFSSIFDGAPSLGIENCPVVLLVLMVTRERKMSHGNDMKIPSNQHPQIPLSNFWLNSF